MKTKTGKFLMQLSAKNQKNNARQVDKQTEQSHLNKQKQNPSRLTISQKLSLQKNVHNKDLQNQMSQLRHQKALLQQEIQMIKAQNNVLKIQSEQIRAQNQELKAFSKKQQEHEPTQQKSKLKSASAQKSQNQAQLLRQPPFLKQADFLRFKQKLLDKINALELQNYRLIEQNYLLLINLKKNLKFYKDCFLNIANKLQNLQYTEASRQIYTILGNMKSDQKSTQNIKKQFFPDRNQDTNNPIVVVRNKLKLMSKIFSISYFPTIKQAPVQIPSQTLIQKKGISLREPSNFHISNSKYRSQRAFSQTNKLFNSSLQQNQIQSLFLDQASINQKIQSDSEGLNVKSRHQMTTIHKCFGNSNELYKLLLLQASVIQECF